jgi:hypothetical protein
MLVADPSFASTSQSSSRTAALLPWVIRCGWLLILTGAHVAGAQVTAIPTRRAAAQPEGYHVATTDESIKLDARFGEKVWQRVDSITDFRQREPVEGAPATERTVVKLVRDRQRLYIAVRAYDSEMNRVRSSQLRRDGDLENADDNFTVLIDSFHDRRGAFLFRTNPNGAMWDAQLVGLDVLNRDWNGIWEVVTRRDADSWSAEFAIPFQTLRFNPKIDAIGLNLRRVIKRKNEEDLWRGWGRTQGMTNLLYSVDISGFGDVGSIRPLDVRPYVLGQVLTPSYDSAGSRLTDLSGGGKAGVDAKLGLTPTMTADLTVNTDFAQVEADQQVINLTRFPTFFPEKREFFLESSGLFNVGTSERVQLFYSRRIGLDTLGAPVPILAGARVYGKVGDWGVGVLDARTGRGENANDLVVRAGRDIFARSSLVAMLVNRSTPGRKDERGAGTDLDLPLTVNGINLEPHFWLMGTQTPVARGTPLAWRISTDMPNDMFDSFVSLYSIDSGFNPTLGFVRRTGIREATGHIDYQPRPGLWGIRQLDFTPIPGWDIIADRHSDITDPRNWQTADFEWHVIGGELQSGDRFEANVRRELDAPAEAFEIFRGTTVAPGRYWWTTADVQYATSAGRPFSGSMVLSSGSFYDGHSRTAELGATYRGGGHLIAGVDYSVTNARLSGGRFTAIQTAGRFEYTFTTRAGFLGFVQFNNEGQRVDFNIRFHWIPEIGDDFYAVWNAGYTTDPTVPERFPSRSVLSHPLNAAFILKAVHRLSW